MLAGSARVDITPPLPVDVLGFVRRPVAPREVVDPLLVTGVVLRQGDLTLAILAADLTNLTPAFAERVRERITAATGFIRGTLEGCALGPSEWEELKVDADAAGTAEVLIRLRTAATRQDLPDAQWLGPFDTSTVDLRALMPELSQGGFIEIEARLVSPDRRSSPSLHEITVQLHCPLG